MNPSPRLRPYSPRLGAASPLRSRLWPQRVAPSVRHHPSPRRRPCSSTNSRTIVSFPPRAASSIHPSLPRRQPCSPPPAVALQPRPRLGPPCLAPFIHHHPSPRRQPCNPRPAVAPPPRSRRGPLRVVPSIYYYPSLRSRP